MHTLLLLHGAIGAADQLHPLAGQLGNDYNIHTLSFSGHGGKACAAGPFSIKAFAAGVLQYMDEHGLPQAHIFGYSMGGYVAMYLAMHHSARIKRVITLATKFHWDEAVAAKEIRMLDPEKIEEKLPAFAATLAARHAPNNWKDVLSKSAAMITAMGSDNPLKPAQYAQITTPVLLLLGDRDKMVTLQETVAVYTALPNAQMGMLPATPHPIEQVDVALLGTLVSNFIDGTI